MSDPGTGGAASSQRSPTSEHWKQLTIYDLPEAVADQGASARDPSQLPPAALPLVLSLFPGIDLLGRGFEQAGFCVVRGPDKIAGGDIRAFHVPAGSFGGVIGGPPCQDFSGLRRTAPTGEGLEMLAEFVRIVREARPDWFLMENVQRVPTVAVPGYTIQRLDLDARECGSRQSRRRTFQFGSRIGSRCGRSIVPERRRVTATEAAAPICTATEGQRSPAKRRTWSEFCALQGLPEGFDLPGMSIAAKYRAVGNGVPIPMAVTIARAVRAAIERPQGEEPRLCLCGCGRPAQGKGRAVTAACRKRMQRRRERGQV